MSEDLCWLGAADSARLIRQKKLSALELTRALLQRIEDHDGALNSFITLTADRALAAAAAAEAAVTAGGELGPLHGVPFALKDIIDVEGVATSCHSALREGHIAADDARVARRLKAAGGILLGKLSTHEFALGGPSFDLPFPPARNPWNPALFPGGSSSGAGAALAAGFVAAAIGTDTGGSVRNPASCCGLVGIKATYGRVSRQGVFPLSYSLDNVGPLTRTVADNALLLDVISGHDPADPGSTRGPASDCRGALGREIAGLRIGVIRHFYRRDLEASGEVGDGIEAALKVLEDLGCEIVEIETEPLQDFAACNRIILLSEACAIHRRWLQERPEAYGQLTRQRLLPGLFLSAGDYVEANRWRRCLSENLDRQLQAVDVAVTASSMEQPFPIDDPDAIATFYPRQARTPFNLSNHPALALPIGFDGDGMPLSMQIVGRHFDEAMIFRVADAYERATGWHQSHPSLA